MQHLNAELEQKFWERVEKADGPDACWLWRENIKPNGYGRFFTEWDPNYSLYAHRTAWIIHHRQQIPENMLVCYHCDNRACVRPSHLFLGSYQDNYNDMVAKGIRHGRQLIMLRLEISAHSLRLQGIGVYCF